MACALSFFFARQGLRRRSPAPHHPAADAPKACAVEPRRCATRPAGSG